MPTVEAEPVNVESVYVPQPATVRSLRAVTAMEKQYELELAGGRPLGHSPGQFVQVSLLGIGECPISICSSPTRPRTFELTIRRAGEVTSAIHRLEPGDAVGIRGPLGRGFDVRKFQGCDTLIVVGGCGLAPARSLIHYILDCREDFGEFYLLYGARSPSELLFKDELEAWQTDPAIQCLVTVDKADGQWQGRQGVVTRLFRELPRRRSESMQVAVIGPPIMFKFVLLELLERRIPEQNIHCSLERRMKCGIGKCGHCQINSLYACLDGPVFSYAELANVREAIE